MNSDGREHEALASMPLQPVLAFVEGRLPPLEFEAVLQASALLERLLTDAPPIPPYSGPGASLYLYLIALDYSDPTAILNAQDVLAKLLARAGVPATPTSVYGEHFDLLLAAQPRWLSVQPSQLAPLLADAPALPRTDLKRWLQARILERFRFAVKPPRWIQAPAWPVGTHGPLVFLGQVALADYFHDEAAVYVFHDPTTGACQTVVQVA